MPRLTDASTICNDETTIHAIRDLFRAQRLASRTLPTLTIKQRVKSLNTIRALILNNGAAIQKSISNDFGNRSTAETEMLEMIPVLNAIRYTRRNLGAWMRPEARPVDLAFQPGRAWIRYEPLGVIGIIAPWNYPLLLSLSPLVDAIAAGNRVMIKPSELTPCFSELLHKLISSHFDTTEVTVVTGGPSIAREFAGLPFDHLIFTGSTSIGREVMKAAAENLTPVTLELGGKSPAIVCADYSLEKAARSIAFGKFLNAGQTCIAPDYVLVPSDLCREFAEKVITRAERAYPTVQENPDYSTIINERHRARILDALAEAKAGGATLLTTSQSSNRLRLPLRSCSEPLLAARCCRMRYSGPSCRLFLTELSKKHLISSMSDQKRWRSTVSAMTQSRRIGFSNESVPVASQSTGLFSILHKTGYRSVASVRAAWVPIMDAMGSDGSATCVRFTR